MKSNVVLGSVLLSASVLTGCGSNSGNDDPIPPFAGVYTPRTATADVNSMAAAYAASPRLQSGVAPVVSTFGNPTVRSLADPASIELEKTADGYILRYDDESVTFTDADVVVDPVDGFDDYQAAGGSISAVARSGTRSALESTTSAMVPLQFNISTNSQGQATPGVRDGQAQGYTIFGLETAGANMPRTGSATYTGRARIDAYSREVTGDPLQVDRIRYSGDVTMSADFGAGTVAGEIDVTQRRTRAGGVQTPNADISASGAAIGLAQTQIIGNGFETTLVNNDAANLIMAADGISADTEASAVGRFYGNNAGEIGAIIAGEGTSHVITGLVTGAQ
jgi:hypothetical protein